MAQRDLLKRYLDAGMAFTAMTKSKAEEIVRELVRAGEIQRDQVQSQVDELVERSRRNTDHLVAIVRKEVASQLADLGNTIRDELRNLESRLGGAGTPVTPVTPLDDATEEDATEEKEAPVKKAPPRKKAAPAKKASPTEKAGPAEKAPARRVAKTAAGGAAAGDAAGTPARKAPAKRAPAKKAPAEKATVAEGAPVGGPKAQTKRAPAKKAAKKAGTAPSDVTAAPATDATPGSSRSNRS